MRGSEILHVTGIHISFHTPEEGSVFVALDS